MSHVASSTSRTTVRPLDSTVHAGGASRGRWWRGVNKRRLYRTPRSRKAASSWPMARTPSTVAGAVRWTMSADLMASPCASSIAFAEPNIGAASRSRMVNILEERRVPHEGVRDRGSFTQPSSGVHHACIASRWEGAFRRCSTMQGGGSWLR